MVSLEENAKNQKTIIKHIVRLEGAVVTISICLAILAVIQIIGLLIIIFSFNFQFFAIGLWISSLLLNLIVIVLALGLFFSMRKYSSSEFIYGGNLFKEYIKRGEYYAELKDFVMGEKYLNMGLEDAQRKMDEKWVKRAELALKKIEENK